MPMNPYDAPHYIPEAAESDLQTPKLWRVHGRIDRAHYLIFSLKANLGFAVFAMMSLLVILHLILPSLKNSYEALPLMWILGFMLLCQAWLAGRRWQDLGRSSAWGLLSLIPLVNVILFFVLLLKSGSSQKNGYGNPVMPPATWEVVVAGILWLPVFVFFSIMMVMAMVSLIAVILG